MDARGKFGEHKRTVRVARGDSLEHSSFLITLQNFQVHALFDVRRAKIMNQFFYNMALKHVLFLIDCNKLSRRTVKENKGLYYPKTPQSVKHQLNENA